MTELEKTLRHYARRLGLSTQELSRRAGKSWPCVGAYLGFYWHQNPCLTVTRVLEALGLDMIVLPRAQAEKVRQAIGRARDRKKGAEEHGAGEEEHGMAGMG